MPYQRQIGDLLNKTLESFHKLVCDSAILLLFLICCVLFIPAQTPAVARSDAMPTSGSDAGVGTHAGVLVILGYKSICSRDSICDIHDVMSSRVAITALVQG